MCFECPQQLLAFGSSADIVKGIIEPAGAPRDFPWSVAEWGKVEPMLIEAMEEAAFED